MHAQQYAFTLLYANETIKEISTLIFVAGLGRHPSPEKCEKVQNNDGLIFVLLHYELKVPEGVSSFN